MAEQLILKGTLEGHVSQAPTPASERLWRRAVGLQRRLRRRCPWRDDISECRWL